MRASRRRRVLIGAAAAVPTALAVAPTAPAAAATAAPPPPEEPLSYCSTTMLTPEQISAGVLSTVRCYTTGSEALRPLGADPSTGRATSFDGATTNGEPVIAYHYENDSPVPLIVNGNACNGGGVSFINGDYWNDRIRSTAPRGCSTVKHFTDANYTGSTETVTGAPTRLNALSGQVSSIRYY